ncbi:zinc finger protein 429-like [Spodoptera frugiperda]|uniref:Zinc finger protein 429-like n=1 Tax=Spodoptera frugiperda TaxID=7108 RepID=A0A9R0D2Z1_SPOFR|nr:zinc finger protein 429-like [Spodoptera frugiperda]
MEGEECNINVEAPYPILFIPKVCTQLETHCQVSENVFIHLNISCPDTFGNETVIYQGFCNVKVLDGNDINIRYGSPDSLTSNENIPLILTEANQITFPAYNDSQVWIDPARSPYVYNRCDSPPKENYTVREAHNNHITIEQHNTYITQNVYQYNEAVRYSSVCEEQKAVEKIQESAQNPNGYNMYEEDEFECGVFLSQLSEEIIHEKETRARDERKFIGLQTDNEALKQLMSSDIQSVSRQQKTILFLGHDSESGQTVQNIAINDPSLECRGARAMETEVPVEPTPDEANTSSTNPRAKKYQCNKCKQIFDQLSAFKQHMVGSHRLSNLYDVSSNVKFMCTDCGKNLKNQEKFEQHCRGHGDPDLECNKCHKVFASKFTLRNHRKIHSRMYPCNFCTKSYSTSQELQAHTTKAHFSFMCECCSFTCENFADLTAHQEIHKHESHSQMDTSKNSSESDFAEAGGLFEEISDLSVPEDMVKREQDERFQTADSVIAKVMSNKIFRSNSTCSSSKSKKQRKYNKTCEVCLKKFDRIGDLKRHLIEHVIRSTLAKNPVNKFGVLNIRCEICQEKVFTKIDRYKAHLREHAKLTLYKCTFCDKSFSDSSNFSKHKKIHGTTYFQCDLCQRKFNSKKMITQHMEYHNNTNPIQCQYCDKVFHFESMLNKHIRCSHTKMSTTKFRCRFCRNYFKSLKEKWDHEWTVHNVRKAIVDCLLCGSRFRKYAELKRHCTDEHDTAIPQAKRLLRWKMKRKMQLLDENL